MENWDIVKSQELYRIHQWGDGYFSVNAKGNVVVRPEANGMEFDLHEVVNSLVSRGIKAPVLIRFDGILRSRLERLHAGFNTAIQEVEYGGKYRCVYPIKVNQQRHVVDAIRRYGREHQLGLEVGSKPELMAVLALHNDPEALLLCNGYKDEDYLELAMLGRKLGRKLIIIIEQPSELNVVLELAERHNIETEIGLRMKPIAKGSGKWESSGGEHAKFGLSAMEILAAIELLKSKGKEHWVKLLHYHVGSQITSIGAIQRVLRESTRMYTEVAKLCPSLCYFDVGGGLAVDYDGSKTNYNASMNYSVEEYARDIVEAIHNRCTEAGVAPPDIITESGRALTAHHAICVVQVADVTRASERSKIIEEPPSNKKTLKSLYELYDWVTVKNCLEAFNDAQILREDAIEQFIQGKLSLVERAYADRIYWQLIEKIKYISKSLRHIPEDLQKLDDQLRDTYFCSFSVFQSLPDSWAIDHLFPVMPIHRLKEQPTVPAILADMSCDSDGMVDKFVDLLDVSNHVPLHPIDNEPYYLGFFLVGAYQEILGDMHNLFGDTNAVHLDFNEDGSLNILHVVEGDTVSDVLRYVQYDSNDLLERLRQAIELALREERISEQESIVLQKQYRESLNSYTYYQV